MKLKTSPSAAPSLRRVTARSKFAWSRRRRRARSPPAFAGERRKIRRRLSGGDKTEERHLPGPRRNRLVLGDISLYILRKGRLQRVTHLLAALQGLVLDLEHRQKLARRGGDEHLVGVLEIGGHQHLFAYLYSRHVNFR